jgi:hypothetical protein
MALSKSARQLALDDLMSHGCKCGAMKQPKQSFCKDCYYALPHGMQMALYKTWGDGYEEAYDNACTYLQANTDRFTQQ